MLLRSVRNGCLLATFAVISLSWQQPVNASGAQSMGNDGGQSAVTPAALEIAELTGLRQPYELILAEKLKAAMSWQRDKPLDKVENDERISYLQVKFSQYMQTANLQLDSAKSKLDRDVAMLSDVRALLSGKRRKSLHRETLINWLSSGMAKVGGYSYALTPGVELPTNLSELADGVIQMALSTLAFREHREQKEFAEVIPDTLSSFLGRSEKTPADYPELVWLYLNHPAPEGLNGQSRRQMLIEHWLKAGKLDRRFAAAGGASSRARRSPTAPAPKQVTVTNIDDTIAMMSELRATVLGMSNGLAELNRLFMSTYEERIK